MDGKHRWRVQNTRMQTGYVPSNYVRKEKPSIFDSIKKKVSFLMKNGNKLFHIFFDPRWRVAGTKAQEAELSHPQTQVLCTVFPHPLIQVRSSAPSYKWARSSSFFMNLLSNVTLYYVWTATNESFLHNTISTTIFSIPLLHRILLLLRYESHLFLFSSTTFFQHSSSDMKAFQPPSPPHFPPPQIWNLRATGNQPLQKTRSQYPRQLWNTTTR